MRNITPKNAMKKKIDVADADKKTVYGRGPATGPAAALGGDLVFFVGLRATGKTTLGRRAAEVLGLPFVDTDALVQQRAGMSIDAMVQEQGWDAFRALETEVLRDLCAGEPAVVATGGGIVLAQENRELLKKGGPVFFLQATTLLVVERLTADQNPDQRPPLTELPLTEEVGEMRRERAPLYLEVANFILKAQEPLDALLGEVREKMQLVAMIKSRG